MLSDPQLHYLDNAATTQVDPAVTEAIHDALVELWANPSSLYDPAVAAQDGIDTARGRIAKTLHCRKDEVYFTACGSESNNMSVWGAAKARRHWGNKIVVTGFEHPSVQLPIRALQEEGFTVTEIMPEADGHIDTQKFLREIDKNTVLAACMAVNNETGAVQDIAALGAGIKARNARTHFHVDAVQAWLRMPIDLQKWKEVDTLAVSGHKVHAPKGVGALFVRDSQRQTLRPPYRGGHQERGMRPGTENTPYIVGLGVAAAKGLQSLRTRTAQIKALNTLLRQGLGEFPDIQINSPADALPEVLNFSTRCINSQTFINYLNTRAVFVSGGSACDKGEPSHTLQAMGCDDLTIRTALRVSLCADNTPEDVQALLDGLRDGLRELQHI
ncbi:cysteine desulfurase family protein [uncultured Gemmiger sp.]|uniref:cysteine desulfurase family protein n=1 Tax=uncultured Gemmiger sp. TaxID=1623490 RepID=UPI0025E10C94|nr:cysteine desulfurase family protein [uncultured Gemmiger sp.]